MQTVWWLLKALYGLLRYGLPVALLFCLTPEGWGYLKYNPNLVCDVGGDLYLWPITPPYVQHPPR